MRYFILTCLVFSLTVCVADNARYYRLHPQALQEALKNCPQSSPRQISCAALVTIADEVDTLAYQLQRDPQGFGNTILTAQTKLAQLEADINNINNINNINHKTQSNLRAQIVQDKQKIAEYLAIVRWLESPEK